MLFFYFFILKLFTFVTHDAFFKIILTKLCRIFCHKRKKKREIKSVCFTQIKKVTFEYANFILYEKREIKGRNGGSVINIKPVKEI